MSARSAGRRLRRTWPQRLLIIFNVFAIVAALSGAGVIVYAKRTVGQIKRTSNIGRDVIIPSDELADDSPRNFLVVGADDDEGLDPNDPIRNDREKETGGTVRYDTIMVVRLDPSRTDAQILSFPRDLTVNIPGVGRNRINAALTYGDGDAGLLIETIRENFAIDINHYVEVNLAGFQNLVKVVDGVPIWFNTPVRDTYSGLNIESAGCTRLDEHSALAYARSRHFRYKNSRGKWVSDPTSDLGRISRQQDFIRRVIGRAIDQGARNIAKLTDMISIGVNHLTLDQYTTPADLIALGRAFRSFDPAQLRTYSLPVTDVVRGGADMLDLVEGEAEPILDMFRGTGSDGPAEERLPGSVTVRVFNGTDVRNQASDTTDLLDSAGFKVTSPRDAEPVFRTQVRYRPGEEAAAMLVARYLDADPALIPDPEVAEITVVTGPDFETVLDTPKAESAISTTTTSTTTTTEVGSGSSTSSTTVPGRELASSDPIGYLPGDPPPGVSCG